MKNKYIVLLLVFISIYILTFIVLLFKIQISYNLLIRFIFSIVGMISIIVLNLKEKSNFVLFFTITSFIFYLFDSYFSICYSIIKSENMLLKNNSFLSNTEGFIMLTCLGYILLVLLRKNKTWLLFISAIFFYSLLIYVFIWFTAFWF
jgi:hypothetical protein